MDIEVIVNRREADVFTVSVLGSIDSLTYSELEREVDALLAKIPRMIIFDMAGVTYISSAGISVILKAKKALEKERGRLIMVNLRPQVRKVFDIIKALPLEAIFKDSSEVDDYLAQIQKRELQKDKPF